MVLNEVEESPVLGSDLEIEDVPRPCTEMPVQRRDVIAQVPVQVGSPGTMERRSQAPWFNQRGYLHTVGWFTNHMLAASRNCPVRSYSAANATPAGMD